MSARNPACTTMPNKEIPMTTGPVIKSAGGKTKLLPELLARMPSSFGRYYEPFVGGGALFFAVRPERAMLGDANADLIATYRAVAEDPDRVVCYLDAHHRQHNKSYYDSMRDGWNRRDFGSQTWSAAAFLYLNRCCYNGLWRVNRKGEFNVPMGRYKDPLAGIAARIHAAAPVLASAELRSGDYRATLANAQAGDFAYIDSPYDGTFTAYTDEGFDAVAQAELAFEVRSLAKRGVMIMVSNADTPRVRALYAGLRIDRVRCPRAINSDGQKRGRVHEVIVTAGYEVPTRAMERAA